MDPKEVRKIESRIKKEKAAGTGAKQSYAGVTNKLTGIHRPFLT